jgi:endonuclease/exonuclease/phosphatase family metal-dependent hydrolase
VFRIATLNTWGLPWPLSRPAPSGRFRHIGRYLREAAFDLVGLQEVWRTSPRIDVGGLHAAPGGAGSGLALVTPLRVVQRSFRGFGRQLFRLEEKGVLHARVVRGDGLEVDVFNTHLRAFRGERNARRRSREIEVLLDFTAGARGPVIVMGDFNFYDANAIDQRTVANMLAAGFRDAIGERPPALTYFFSRERERFDRIYVACRFCPITSRSRRRCRSVDFLMPRLPPGSAWRAPAVARDLLGGPACASFLS